MAQGYRQAQVGIVGRRCISSDERYMKTAMIFCSRLGLPQTGYRNKSTGYEHPIIAPDRSECNTGQYPGSFSAAKSQCLAQVARIVWGANALRNTLLELFPNTGQGVCALILSAGSSRAKQVPRDSVGQPSFNRSVARCPGLPSSKRRFPLAPAGCIDFLYALDLYD